MTITVFYKNMQTSPNIISISAPPPYSGAPTMTKVTGYYNPFDYPFQLHLPELNRQFILAAREFVTISYEEKDPKTGKAVRKKTKVNDPIFENFVGPNKLAKEEGEEDVPIIWLVRPVLQPIPTHMFEFAGTNRFKTDENGRVLSPEMVMREQQQQTTPVPSSASSITGYTMDQAKKMGIIPGDNRGAIPEREEIPADTTPPQHRLPQSLPRGAAKQPNVEAPVPPPLAPPPKDDRILMPRGLPASAPKVNPPPTAPVGAPPVGAPTAAAEVVAEIGAADDIMSDVPPTDGKVTVEATDLTQLTRNAATAAGVKPATPAADEVKLPEPKVLESAPVVVALPPVAPTVAAAPVVPPVVTSPEAPKKRTRRTLKNLFGAKTESQPVTTPPAQTPPV
jgi:hypothetical protein